MKCKFEECAISGIVFCKRLDTLPLQNISIKLHLSLNACLNAIYMNNFTLWFSNTKFFSIMSILDLIFWIVNFSNGNKCHVSCDSIFIIISDKFCLNLYLLWEVGKESRWILNIFNTDTSERFLCNLFAYF